MFTRILPDGDAPHMTNALSKNRFSFMTFTEALKHCLASICSCQLFKLWQHWSTETHRTMPVSKVLTYLNNTPYNISTKQILEWKQGQITGISGKQDYIWILKKKQAEFTVHTQNMNILVSDYIRTLNIVKQITKQYLEYSHLKITF